MYRSDDEWQRAVSAVRVAGHICRRVQHRLGEKGVLAKKDRSPVTVADFASQAVVCAELAAAFAADPVVAEEGSAQLRQSASAPILEEVGRLVGEQLEGASSEQVLGWIDHGGGEPSPKRFWTLDPIDGTKGFLRGDQYAIALALIEKGRVVLGVLGCPNLAWEPGSAEPTGVVFAGSPEEGCWVEPLGEEGESCGEGGESSLERSAKRVEAPKLTKLEDGRFCESVESAHTDQKLSQSIAKSVGLSEVPFRIDSQCKYAVVSRGEASVYLRVPKSAEYREKIWDHAAGMAVVESAGGKVSDLDGRRLDFTQGKRLTQNRGVLATSGGVHDRVLEAIRELSV
jgi:3'(2'), 5'-bisphosphate nucleotidase